MRSQMADPKAPALLLSPEEDTGEIMALASSAGYRIVRTFVQRRESPNPKFYFGEGKVEEVAGYITSCGPAKKGKKADKAGIADERMRAASILDEEDRGPPPAGAADRSERPQVAIFNGPLKPSQVFHLEKALGISVFDRIRLILEIFDKRANSPEARLQVELAHLQYNVPLVKEYIHRTRTGEHPGLFFAGGAYQVDEYYEMIKARMARIRRDLETISKERAQRRKTRRRGGLALIALAGYTNAGKSALFRALSADEETIVGEELFTTLSTSTRRLRSRVQGSKVLLTDTVGFIRNLPVWLVEAFMSTLEEVFLSDAIILLLDLSDGPDELLAKLDTTLGILRKGRKEMTIIVAFNKADLLDTGEIERRVTSVLSRHSLPLRCTISALSAEGLPELVRLCLSSLDDFFFGTIIGPLPAMYRLAREDGIAPGPGVEGRAIATEVLLRNWQLQKLMQKYPDLEFKKDVLPIG